MLCQAMVCYETVCYGARIWRGAAQSRSSKVKVAIPGPRQLTFEEPCVIWSAASTATAMSKTRATRARPWVCSACDASNEATSLKCQKCKAVHDAPLGHDAYAAVKRLLSHKNPYCTSTSNHRKRMNQTASMKKAFLVGLALILAVGVHGKVRHMQAGSYSDDF